MFVVFANPGQVKKNVILLTLGKLKNVILLTLGKSKNIAILLTLGNSKNIILLILGKSLRWSLIFNLNKTPLGETIFPTQSSRLPLTVQHLCD